MLALLLSSTLMLPATTPALELQAEVLHGLVVKDPYRTLEDDGAGKTFAREQSKKTEEWLKAKAVPGLRQRVEELLSIGYVSKPALGGGKVFYVRQDGKAEQPAFVVNEGGKEKVLLDLTKADPSGKTALDWFYPSDSGRYVAYGISKNGDENSVLHVMDTKTGKPLKEAIPDTRWCDVTWLRDESGFYYRRFPSGGRYDPRIYLHKLGADWKKDPLVFGDGLDKTYWPSTSLSEDGKSIAVTVSRGWSASDLYWMDAKTHQAKPLLVGENALFEDAHIRDGKLLVRTNLDASRWRIVRIDPAKPNKDAWETLVPESAETLESMLPVKGGFVTASLDRAVSKVQVRDNGGKKIADVAMPALGSVARMAGKFSSTNVVLEFTSFTISPRLFTLDVAKAPGTPKPFVEVKSKVDLSRFVVDQVEYRSYDGTPVPMFIVHDKTMKKDSSNGVLMTGYGGFNVSYTPGFIRRLLYWLDRGGVVAVPNLRGGGEFGEAWHQAGRKQNKHQVFADFEYAMRHLVTEGYTRPERLCITGGSNGGLLMGAQITRAPYLFKAVYAAVGLFDMLRYHRWPPAELWVDEYGSSESAQETPYLWAYSPYHQVVPGVRYPATFIATAEEDTRVTWIHSAKFAARLQQAQTGDAPILLHMEGAEGHGAGKGRTDQVEDAERMYTFFLAMVPLDGKK